MNIKYQKLGWALAFLGMSLFSTWATVESLHHLWDYPKLVMWAVCLAVFYLASLGVALITRAFDYNKIHHGRLKYLIGGILLFGGFWIVMILPTNTHTFFYARKIKEITVKDIKHTRDSLQILPRIGENYIEKKKQKLKSAVSSEITNLHNEINDPKNRGFSHKSDSIQTIISDMLGHKKIQQPKRSQFMGEKEFEDWSNLISDNWYQQLDVVLKDYDAQKVQFKALIDTNKIISIVQQLDKSKSELSMLSEPNAHIKSVLEDGHLEIERLRNLPEIADGLDKKSQKNLSATDFENVFEVWKAFFRGDFNEDGFWYYILIAIVIDCSGFLFYYLAFERDNDF